MSELDEIADELKGSGGKHEDKKPVDTKSYTDMKESNIGLSPATKLGQSTPTNLHRSVV